LPEPVDHAVGVAQKERSCVYQDSFSFRGFDLEPPQHGLSERFFDSTALCGI
jgi:hypothetical protein